MLDNSVSVLIQTKKPVRFLQQAFYVVATIQMSNHFLSYLRLIANLDL